METTLSVNASASRTVTVATVQLEPIIGDRARDLAAIERLVATARAGGADLVVLPELADRIGTGRGQPFIGFSLIVGQQGRSESGPASFDREETKRTGVRI